MVLFAVAGLLVLAFAGPRAGSPVPGSIPAQRRQFLDSLRTLTPDARHAALIQWIRAGRAVRQASRGHHPGTPRKLGNLTSGPITFADEFMPAPYAASGDQQYVAVAFDGTNYLIVWEDHGNGSYYPDIYYARVNADGSILDPSGHVLAEHGSDYGLHVPAVAFDGTTYLVVWEDHRGYDNDPSTAADIYGAYVGTDGSHGTPFEICGTAEVQQNPAVAWNGTKYLVVWEDGNDYNIHGALVNTDKSVTPLTDPISSSENCYSATVASDGSGYLVAWTDYGDIYGNLVSGGGVVGESEIRITTDQSAYPEYPSAGYDGTNYLVAWDEYRNGNCDVYGARVTSDGDPDVQDIEIALSEWDEWHASVAFDGTDYIVTWEDDHDYSNPDIYGAQVSKEGDPGDAFPISTEANSQARPAVACSGSPQNTVLVAYQSITGVVAGEHDYGNTARIWARPGLLPTSGGNVGTVSIEHPVGSFLLPSCVIPPEAKVYNYGAATRSFAAKFTIYKDNVNVYSSTKLVLALAPSDDPRPVDFAPFYLPTGTFTARCSTMLADDETKTNDSMTAVFQGCDFIDYADLTDEGYTPDDDDHWDNNSPDEDIWTTPPPMDDYAWGNRLDETYDEDEDASLTSPVYTASQDDPSIAFQHIFQISDDGDGGYLEYRIGSGSWTWKAPSAGEPYTGIKSYWYGNWSGWKQSVFTFTDVNSTDKFQVRWHLKANGDANVSYGWLVDEIAGIGCSWGSKFQIAGYIDTMKVWPNPAHGKALVSYTLLKAGNVIVKLYDASGRLAQQVPTGGFKKGKNTATLDASKLARGVYFVKVAGASNTKTTKVIIE
jgi:hypothetical protein